MKKSEMVKKIVNAIETDLRYLKYHEEMKDYKEVDIFKSRLNCQLEMLKDFKADIEIIKKYENIIL